MFKKIFSIILVVGMGYGSLKVYLHHKVLKDIDQFVLQLSPSMDITYNDVSTSVWRQSFTIKDITISLKKHNDITAHSLTFLGADFFSNDIFQPPNLNQHQKQTIEIKGLNLNLLQTLGALSSNATYLNFLETLKALNYDSVQTDLTFFIETFPRTKFIDFYHAQIYPNIGKIEVNAQLSGFHLKNYALSDYKDLELIMGSIAFEDHAIIPKLIRYKAKMEGIPIPQVREQLLEDLTQYWKNQNFPVNSDLKIALQQFMDQESSITMHIKPIPAIRLKTLSHLNLFKTQDITKMLNVTFSSDTSKNF